MSKSVNEKVLEEFEQMYCKIPPSVTRESLHYWIELFYNLEPKYTFDFIVKLAIVRLKKPPPRINKAIPAFPRTNIYFERIPLFLEEEFIPEHELLFNEIKTELTLFKPSTFITSPDIDHLKSKLLHEIIYYNIELAQAADLIKSFNKIKNSSPSTLKELLECSKLFKNFDPKQKIVNAIVMQIPSVASRINEISYKLIDVYIIELDEIINFEAKKEERFAKLFIKEKKVKLEYGLDLGMDTTNLKKIFQSLINEQFLDPSTEFLQFEIAFNKGEISEDYKKIRWITPTDLAVFIGKYIDSPRKWAVSKILFEESKNLKSINLNNTQYKTHNQRIKFFDSILKIAND